MFPSIMICPATCELCGQWMPDHNDNCPRSGVHPSQWTLQDFEPESDDSSTDKESFVISNIYWPPTIRNMMTLMED
ncbi:hypothetical protein MFLAVUS_003755 [Mucor flavus]|uniref:Uncharacterized protein n=1 Tax=Mucor flavus TaxID=439312 RepID=A0ABP9YTZ4_9FUNG